ncbi:hypothetical protein GCM10010172_49490 [Paractinoplanes ferrugineus]|uniref:Uncharacterized protein n=1 Tax=Paractinoplanes ferrugineus TaxID=113564 RepID=A0A919J818_9ACTN|nr:hypothetical protein Afe05nite_76280 [Actinoplanes ferrugineus]
MLRKVIKLARRNGLLGGGEADGGHRALVIASETHELSSCNNGAELVTRMLTERGFTTTSIPDGEATRSCIPGAFPELIPNIVPAHTVDMFHAGRAAVRY